MKQNKTALLVFTGLILIAATGRLLHHEANFTPVMAIAFFAAFYFRNRYAAILAVILAMLISDLAIGFDSVAMRLTVYGSLLVPVLFGRILRSKSTESFQSVYALGFTLTGSIVFYLTTNFVVWLTSGMYTMNLTGLVLCYINAIPFFKTSLAGDLFYTGLLFSIYLFSRSMLPNRAQEIAGQAIES